MIRNKLESILRSVDELESVDFNQVKDFVSSGLLDSFAVLMLVSKLEQAFQVKIELDDNIADSMDSLELIEKLIQNSKKK